MAKKRTRKSPIKGLSQEQHKRIGDFVNNREQIRKHGKNAGKTKRKGAQ